MSPRRYNLGAREAAIAETRQRIVTAARQLIVDGDFRRVTMDEIARCADVARATVYHQLGSKLGLVEAVINDLEARAGLDALIAVVEGDPPSQLIPSVVAAGCRYWATDPDLVRKVIGLASLESDVQQLVTRHDEGRLRILTHMVSRLHDAHILYDGCSPEHAINVLWLLTSFDAYDLLTRGRELAEHRATNLLTALAEHQLVRASAQRKRRTRPTVTPGQRT